jgi:signal transduction histidine kinase/CheY-like chemotaxis protein
MVEGAPLASLVSALTVGVLVETAERRVQVANQAFCDIFGIPVPPHQLVGADCAAAAEQVADLFESRTGFLGGIESLLRDRRAVMGEELSLRDGRVLERDFLTVDLGQGQEQIVWIYKDITALATLRRETGRARDEAVALAQQRSALLATVTHEVRTPMVALVGLADALDATALPLWARDAIAAIRSSADSLVQLLEDVLDLGRLDHDSRALRAAPYDVESLLAEAVETVGVTARRLGVLLTSRVDPDVPPRVLGDAPRLRQVVLNLVVNAVKFAADEVVVVARRYAETVEIVVEDDGPGIDPATLQRMFDPFVQGEAHAITAGVGLGLAITAQLVERMGGHISMENRDPHGTRAVVTLPLALPRTTVPGGETAVRLLSGLGVRVYAPTAAVRAALDRVLSARQAELLGEGSPDSPAAVVVVGDATDGRLRADVAARQAEFPTARHVVLTRRSAARDAIAGAVTLGLPPDPDQLVAAIRGADERSLPAATEALAARRARVVLGEDDYAIRTVVTRMLVQLGATVEATMDGEQALTAALASIPDVVLLDLRLPKLSGVEVVQRLRADPRGRELTLVVMSASVSDASRSDALAAGADAYLAKPVTRDQLHDLLVSLVPEPSTDQTTSGAVKSADAEETELVNRARLDQMADEVGDADVVLDAVRMFLDELPRRLSHIAEAVQTGDTDAVATTAHALGSSAIMLGADRLGQRCRRLEAASDRDGMLGLSEAVTEVASLTEPALRAYLAGSGSSP